MINCTKAFKVLEFEKIKAQLASLTSSEDARDLVLSLEPFIDVSIVKEELQKTFEADKIIFEHATHPGFGFDNVSEQLATVSRQGILNFGELLRIARLLKTSRVIKNSIDRINDDEIVLIRDLVARLYVNLPLEDHIFKDIISESEISDNASDTLKLIRKKIKKCADDIKNKLQSYVTSNQYQKYLQDFIVTVRNDRYVIPLKCEYKGMIPGLVHDQSASGATIYVEPMPVVELNNQYRLLFVEESKEIDRILKAYSTQISYIVDDLSNNSKVIAELDLAFSKANFSYINKCTMPIINTKGYINIKRGRHPLIEKSKVVPVSITLGDDYNILLITGPNTGGKTVTLKLLGLLTVMALSGLFIPADEGSEISDFECLFCDIGDDQSIENSLSTFSSHIKKISEIVDCVNDKSLVLLDELGAGTDPVEGAALAVAITDYIKNSGAKALLTTHYSELKVYSYNEKSVQNASMDFDPDTYNPTYRLNIGMPGASNALHICTKLGLKNEIIDNARQNINEDKIRFENVILEAEISKNKYEKLLLEIDNIKFKLQNELDEAKKERSLYYEQREKIKVNAKIEAQRIIDSYVDEAKDLIDQIRRAQLISNDQALFEARRLKAKLESLDHDEKIEPKIEYTKIETPISVGDHVIIQSINAKGIVKSIKNKEVKIAIGSIIGDFKLSDVIHIEGGESKIQKSSKAKTSLNVETISNEINVIGQNRDDCLINVELFLDKAIRSGLNEVKIIHGKGAGILKKTIWEYLKSLKTVKSFRSGKYGEGEIGVTFVVFK